MEPELENMIKALFSLVDFNIIDELQWGEYKPVW